MEIWFILSIIAALCIVPTLIMGAKSDLKTRTFPMSYWKYTSKAGFLFVGAQYASMLWIGLYFNVGLLLVISCMTSLFFLFMGYRFGSGGDWRALVYIAWIAPALIIGTCILSLVYGFIQATVEIIKHKHEPIFGLTIPFAVSICLGYCTMLVYYVWMNL